MDDTQITINLGIPYDDRNKVLRRTIGGTCTKESVKLIYGIANKFFNNSPKNLEIFLRETEKNYDDDDDDESSHEEQSSIINYKKNVDLGLCFNTPYSFEYKNRRYAIYIEKISEHPCKMGYSDYEYYYDTHIYTSIVDISLENACINIKSLYKECLNYYERHYLNIKNDSNKIRTYTNTSEYWSLSGAFQKRYEDTLYCPKELLNSIFSSINTFIKNKPKYTKLCIPYKLNLLFKGEPGTGKTTLTKVIASKYNFDIRTIHFTSTLNDENFSELIRKCKPKTILLLEDFDCLFVSSKKNDEFRNSVSFSSILNVLDGLGTCEGLITILTTNNVELLEPKLIRSGRIDKIIDFGFIKKKEMNKMFNNFCYIEEIINQDEYDEQMKRDDLTSVEKEKIPKPKQTSKEDKQEKFNEFYSKFKELSINATCSLLQGYLMNYFDNPDLAIEEIDKLKEMHSLHKVENDKKLYT